MFKSPGTKIIICILICLTLGFLSGISTAEDINGWYVTLRKPSWNPPNRVFGPVWSLLYCLMGISIALIWHQPFPASKKKAYGLFGLQFVLNLLWSFIFFKMHNPALALAEITVMWCLIVLTILQFHKIRKVSAYLLIPYLLWVSFAAILNASIYSINYL